MRLIDADDLKEKSIIISDGPIYKEVIPISAIDNAPTVDFERPQSEWVVDEEHSITMTFYKCTHCNYFCGTNHHRYCPNCGADMRGERK